MTATILGALMNGTIAAALLAVAVRAGLALAPRRMLSAAARYAVWWVALVAAVLLPLAYLPTTPARHADATSHRAVPVGQPAPMPPAGSATRVALTPVHTPVPTVFLRFPVVVAVGGWLQWIPIAWACLSGLMLLRLLASCILLGQRKSGAVAAPDPLIERVADALARRGSSRRAVILRSAEIGTPMLAGLRQPAILIPERLFAELTEDELTQIGLHEAAHLARWDDYALVASRAIEALLPFHPVVRWIARQIDLERELACDEFVAQSTGSPRSYAACLLRVVELCNGASTSWAAARVAGSRSQLTKRVNRLLERSCGINTRTSKARLFTAVSVAGAAAWLAGRAPGALALAVPAIAAEAPQIVAPVAYQTNSAQPKPTPAPPAPSVLHPAAPVLFPLTVQSLDHRDVTGLTKDSVQVFEDGVEQRISEVAVDNPPLSVEIVVDMSGSMRDKQALIDAAVTQLVNSANRADEFLLVTFQDHVDLAGPFPSDPAQILNQLHLRQARGGTALRDAVLQAAEWRGARNPDRILVVISDGVDNTSSVGVEELRAATLAARAPVWAITLASAAAYPRRESRWLGDLADQSMGHEFVSDVTAEIADVAASIANQGHYVLKYNSTNQTLDGKFRRVKVEIATAAPGTVRIDAGLGYYAPVGKALPHSREYYIFGQVGHAGEFDLVAPTRVSEALANAGGYKDFAKISKIRIVRELPGGKYQVFKYNDTEVSHGENLEQNIYLEPGDRIYVE